MPWGSIEVEPEVEQWLELLPVAEFGQAAFHIDVLAERGVGLGEPYTKQLSGKLRELRFYVGGQAVRICSFVASGRRQWRSEGRMPRDWESIKSRRMAEPEARRGYEQARFAFELGERIRTLREDHGVSQSQLAKRIGSTQPSIARLEGGGVTPSLETLDRIASALGLDLVVRFDRARLSSHADSAPQDRSSRVRKKSSGRRTKSPPVQAKKARKVKAGA